MSPATGIRTDDALRPSGDSLGCAVKVVLPDAPSSSSPTARPGSTPRARSGRSSPSRRCSSAPTAPPQDLRLPLADGARLQILTTRDTHDPDALAVLRHSAAHLLAEAVRRLYPGVKIAIGPPIENGFYYDFEFPAPISEDDLERIEAEVRRELAEGRVVDARGDLGRRGPRALRGRGRAVQGRARRHRRGRDLALHAGRLHRPLPRPAPAELGADQGVQAHRRSPAPTGAATSNNTQLTRIYGTAFYSQDDLDEHLERLEEARARDHRRLGPQLDLFHFDEHSPGLAVLASRRAW